MTLFEIIKNANLIDAVEQEISDWHDDCELGCDGECEIYDALQQNIEGEALINIAYDADANLFDKFNLDLSQLCA